MPTTEAPTQPAQVSSTFSRSTLIDRYKTIRTFTEALTDPLKIEDFVIQVAEQEWEIAPEE